MITGLGLPSFDDAILGLHMIESILSREFRENQLERYQPSAYQTFASLECSSRYFSPRKDISSQDFLTFPVTIDPRGFLKELEYHDLAYAPDNVVEYYKDADNKYVCQSKPLLQLIHIITECYHSILLNSDLVTLSKFSFHLWLYMLATSIACVSSYDHSHFYQANIQRFAPCNQSTLIYFN